MMVSFSGRDIFLHHSGIAILPNENMAIVSDMHLEKASHFARRGFFLPPYDSHETLVRLHTVLAEENIERLLVLGDCFHDAGGYERLPAQAHELFDELRRFQPIWVSGNHDGDFVPPGFAACEEYQEGGLVFRHEAAPDAENEISGHFHPKASIVHKHARISKDCFIEDGYKLVMPAFGSYTGGLCTTTPAIRHLFKAETRVYVLGEQRVFAFAHQDIMSL